jgi:hypothetical protein
MKKASYMVTRLQFALDCARELLVCRFHGALLPRQIANTLAQSANLTLYSIGFGTLELILRELMMRSSKNAVVLACFVLTGCSRGPYPVPAAGPPEDVLRAIKQAQYDAMSKAGTTVSGRAMTLTLEPRIWEVEGSSCKPDPVGKPGEFACTIDMQVTLVKGDTKPGKHSERVSAIWDAERGEWLDADLSK